MILVLLSSSLLIDFRLEFRFSLYKWFWTLTPVTLTFWILKARFQNSYIPGMCGLIDMERKGYELIWYWTYYMTFVWTYRWPWLELSRSSFEITGSQVVWLQHPMTYTANSLWVAETPFPAIAWPRCISSQPPDGLVTLVTSHKGCSRDFHTGCIGCLLSMQINRNKYLKHLALVHLSLTHCLLVKPYRNTDPGQHWLMLRLAV